PLLGREGPEVGDLGLAQHVEPVRGEPAGVARQGEARARHLRVRELAIEPELAGERLELERVAPPGEEIAEPEHQGVTGPAAARAAGAAAGAGRSPSPAGAGASPRPGRARC